MRHFFRSALCLTLLLIVGFSLTACGGVPGTYEPVSARIDGVEMTPEEFNSHINIYYLEMNDDNTGTIMYTTGKVESIQWDDSAIWPVDYPEERVPYTLSGDQLTLYLDGTGRELTLKRK